MKALGMQKTALNWKLFGTLFVLKDILWNNAGYQTSDRLNFSYNEVQCLNIIKCTKRDSVMWILACMQRWCMLSWNICQCNFYIRRFLNCNLCWELASHHWCFFSIYNLFITSGRRLCYLVCLLIYLSPDKY